MANIVIDKSVTIGGGYHPAIITDGVFKGTAFVVQDITIDENGKVEFQYSIVRGDIMDHQRQELDEIIFGYIKDMLKVIMNEDQS
jgi:hexokinase